MKSVLVAEDNVAMARVVQFNLQQNGYQVAVAHNGRVALELAQSEQFDALVTDYQMPEMDGVELCRHLRNLASYHHVPIMLLTAKGMELELPKLREELQLSATFSKPFSPSAVVKMLGELLST